METKNNTCAVCRKHIDKSDASSSWLTLIRARFFGDAHPENKRDVKKGYHLYKGNRLTLCSLCFSKVYQMVLDMAYYGDRNIPSYTKLHCSKCGIGQYFKPTGNGSEIRCIECEKNEVV